MTLVIINFQVLVMALMLLWATHNDPFGLRCAIVKDLHQ